MPRVSTIRKTKHEQTTAQDTYRWTTPKSDVNARPVDAFAAPAMSKDGQRILSAMDTIAKAGRSFARGKAIDEQYQTKKGTEAYDQGKTADEAAKYGDKALQVFNGKQGIADAARAKADYAKVHSESLLLTDEEYDKNMAKVAQTWSKGKDDYWKGGFNNTSQHILAELKANKKINDVKVAQDQELENIGMIVNEQLDMIQGGVIDPQTISREIRDSIAVHHETGALIGLDKKSINAYIAKQVYSYAERNRDLGVLDVLDIPDEHGVSLNMTGLNDATNAARDAVLNGMDKDERRELKIQEEQRKEFLKGYHEQLDAYAKGDKNAPSIEELRESYYSNKWRFDYTTNDSLRKRLDEMESGIFDFPNNKVALDDLSYRAQDTDISNNPTSAEIEKSYQDGLINYNTRNSLLSLVRAQDKTFGSGAGAGVSKEINALLKEVDWHLPGQSQSAQMQAMGGSASYDMRGLAKQEIIKRIREMDNPTAADMRDIQEKTISKYTKLMKQQREDGSGFVTNPIANIHSMYTKGDINSSDYLYNMRQFHHDFTLTFEDLEAMYAPPPVEEPPKPAAPAEPKDESKKNDGSDDWKVERTKELQDMDFGSYLMNRGGDVSDLNEILKPVGLDSEQWKKAGGKAVWLIDKLGFDDAYKILNKITNTMLGHYAEGWGLSRKESEDSDD